MVPASGRNYQAHQHFGLDGARGVDARIRQADKQEKKPEESRTRLERMNDVSPALSTELMIMIRKILEEEFRDKRIERLPVTKIRADVHDLATGAVSPAALPSHVPVL